MNPVTVSRTSDVEYVIQNVRRGVTGEAYPSGTVSATVRVYNPSGSTPLQAAMTATWDPAAGGYVAIIPAVPAGYSSVLIRETVVANGRTLITDVVAPVV